jgi:D-alanine-D-alanine ligase
LVEHFIEGRELTVGVVGNLVETASRRLNERTRSRELPAGLTFMPVLEVATEAYETESGIYTNRMKTEWADDYYYHCPAPLEPDFERELQLLTAAVFRVTGCKDVARVDYRLDAANDDKPYILEVNPLPGLNPSYSDLCLQAEAMDWPHARLVNTILDEALGRYGL